MGSKTGPKCPDGVRTSKTKKGHLRIVSRGPDRGKYLHRAHVERMLSEVWHPYFGDKLPADMTIHHMDWDKKHNCSCNYLVTNAVIHGKIEQSRLVRDAKGRYRNILKKGRKTT